MADENEPRKLIIVQVGNPIQSTGAGILMNRTLSDKSNHGPLVAEPVKKPSSISESSEKENMAERRLYKSKSLPLNHKGTRSRKPLERSETENSQDGFSEMESNDSLDGSPVEFKPDFDSNNNGFNQLTVSTMDEPMDPTCNLRMLCSALSPEIKKMQQEREREEGRSSAASSMISLANSGLILSPSEENSREGLMSSQDSQVNCELELYTSRKDKSLGRLCDK